MLGKIRGIIGCPLTLVLLLHVLAPFLAADLGCAGYERGGNQGGRDDGHAGFEQR